MGEEGGRRDKTRFRESSVNGITGTFIFRGEFFNLGVRTRMEVGQFAI